MPLRAARHPRFGNGLSSIKSLALASCRSSAALVHRRLRSTRAAPMRVTAQVTDTRTIVRRTVNRTRGNLMVGAWKSLTVRCRLHIVRSAFSAPPRSHQNHRPGEGGCLLSPFPLPEYHSLTHRE